MKDFVQIRILRLVLFISYPYRVSGEERYSAVTQFEATDARRCFPCWDEPAHKATFGVTLIVPHDRVPLSNMVRHTFEV